MRKVKPQTYYVQRNTRSIKNHFSSSLRQLQSASQKLERELSEIKSLIEQGEGGASTGPSLISGAAGGSRRMSLLSAELMEQAEEGERKWSAIGLDDWIEAGKWWLMKVG